MVRLRLRGKWGELFVLGVCEGKIIQPMIEMIVGERVLSREHQGSLKEKGSNSSYEQEVGKCVPRTNRVHDSRDRG